MKRPSVHINNMWIKQLCNHKVWDFATALRDFRERGPWRLGRLFPNASSYKGFLLATNALFRTSQNIFEEGQGTRKTTGSQWFFYTLVAWLNNWFVDLMLSYRITHCHHSLRVTSFREWFSFLMANKCCSFCAGFWCPLSRAFSSSILFIVCKLELWRNFKYYQVRWK